MLQTMFVGLIGRQNHIVTNITLAYQMSSTKTASVNPIIWEDQTVWTHQPIESWSILPLLILLWSKKDAAIVSRFSHLQ